MNHMVVTAAAYLVQRGLKDWTVGLCRLTNVQVQVRATRQHIAIGADFAQTRDLDALLAQLEHFLEHPLEHPGWQAECPSCHRAFYRSKPAAAVHTCAECRVPLEFG